ncbi:hypothetical protein [Streptomyces griseocarneus]|uniref:hypothetical protein n=1 Tax=Streptomyces griseocarneus TaxID=51201 RepID=UPI00167EBD22|nr:hypothetical protein [Streptomyces griseocarneus]MBZ6476399.1 hypothetical protein [Streptomyces griseocarneus]
MPQGVRIERSPGEVFTLRREFPGAHPFYYRVGYGRLEWSDDLSALVPRAAWPRLDPGHLLTLVHGTAPAPDATPVPEVQRLAVGTVARVDASGVTVTRRVPEMPAPAPGLAQAVGDALSELGAQYAIAYSGGLSSAFTAVSALEAGHRPVLLHADFGEAFRRAPVPNVPDLPDVPDVPGLTTCRVPVDPSELLDHRSITGDEPFPPLPDTEVSSRLVARLSGAAGLPVAAGALLEDLTAITLPEADAGVRGRRLLACEPFHITGTLRGLSEARELMSRGAVFAPGLGGREIPDEQPVGMPPPPKPLGAALVPVLTEAGEAAYASAQLATMALWKEHLDFLPTALGRVVAGLAERGGGGGAVLPALDPTVIATVASLRRGRLGRIHRGSFRTHLPLYEALERHRISGVRRSAPGHWLRVAAAVHLRREREKVIARMTYSSPLADMGLVDPRKVTDILRDAHRLTDHALPLLRAVWLDQWLRGRS